MKINYSRILVSTILCLFFACKKDNNLSGDNGGNNNGNNGGTNNNGSFVSSTIYFGMSPTNWIANDSTQMFVRFSQGCGRGFLVARSGNFLLEIDFSKSGGLYNGLTLNMGVNESCNLKLIDLANNETYFTKNYPGNGELTIDSIYGNYIEMSFSCSAYNSSTVGVGIDSGIVKFRDTNPSYNSSFNAIVNFSQDYYDCDASGVLYNQESIIRIKSYGSNNNWISVDVPSTAISGGSYNLPSPSANIAYFLNSPPYVTWTTSSGIINITSHNPSQKRIVGTFQLIGTHPFVSDLDLQGNFDVVYDTYPSIPVSGSLPSVTTDPVSNISTSSATAGGFVSSDGGVPVTQRGLCWGTSPNPTISANFSIDGSGTGGFTSSLSGLAPNTTYYIRAYALNSIGISYGNEESFTTSLPYTSIANVRAVFMGSITNVPAGMKVRGIVTSDYTNNNLPGQNLTIQDASGAIVIRFSSVHTFSLGTELEVELSGQELSEFYSLLQINNVPIVNAVVVGFGTVIPRTATISQLLANYSSWESQVVRINGLTISGTGTYSGVQTLSDGTGTITLYTRPLASFASQAYPTGIVSITGVLSEYSLTSLSPQIVIRNTNDVQ